MSDPRGDGRGAAPSGRLIGAPPAAPARPPETGTQPRPSSAVSRAAEAVRKRTGAYERPAPPLRPEPSAATFAPPPAPEPTFAPPPAPEPTFAPPPAAFVPPALVGPPAGALGRGPPACRRCRRVAPLSLLDLCTACQKSLDQKSAPGALRKAYATILAASPLPEGLTFAVMIALALGTAFFGLYMMAALFVGKNQQGAFKKYGSSPVMVPHQGPPQGPYGWEERR